MAKGFDPETIAESTSRPHGARSTSEFDTVSGTSDENVRYAFGSSVSDATGPTPPSTVALVLTTKKEGQHKASVTRKQDRTHACIPIFAPLRTAPACTALPLSRTVALVEGASWKPAATES